MSAALMRVRSLRVPRSSSNSNSSNSGPSSLFFPTCHRHRHSRVSYYSPRRPPASRRTSTSLSSSSDDDALLASLGLDLDALEPPAIDGDLESFQREMNAEFLPDEATLTSVSGRTAVPANYNNLAEARTAAQQSAVVVDRSHWMRIRLVGANRHEALAAASQALGGSGTHDIDDAFRAQNLSWASGETNKDIALAAALRSAILVLVPPSKGAQVLSALEDACASVGGDAAVVDIEAETRMLFVAGPTWTGVVQAFEEGATDRDVALVQFGGAPVIAITGVGLVDGAMIVADQACAGELFGALVRAGCVPVGEMDWCTI